LNIKVSNPDKVFKGVKSISVNGCRQTGNFIGLALLKDCNDIEVTMG
jgi:hypothetical protein